MINVSKEETNNTNEIVWDRRPMVMINGKLYFDTGKESDLGARCGVMDGEISSTINGSQLPVQDDQSNFGDGYGYQFVNDNSIDIYMNEKWVRFEYQAETNEKSEDIWGIQLTVNKITSSGLTLVCSQFGGKLIGNLQTGSPYLLEIQINNEWVPVEMLSSKYELAWTEEAWMIPLNESTVWDVNWKNLYGELPVGKYRIGKEIINFRGSADYNTNTYYADFELVN